LPCAFRNNDRVCAAAHRRGSKARAESRHHQSLGAALKGKAESSRARQRGVSLAYLSALAGRWYARKWRLPVRRIPLGPAIVRRTVRLNLTWIAKGGPVTRSGPLGVSLLPLPRTAAKLERLLVPHEPMLNKKKARPIDRPRMRLAGSGPPPPMTPPPPNPPTPKRRHHSTPQLGPLLASLSCAMSDVRSVGLTHSCAPRLPKS
jgi:hypothetical protein